MSYFYDLVFSQRKCHSLKYIRARLKPKEDISLNEDSTSEFPWKKGISLSPLVPFNWVGTELWVKSYHYFLRMSCKSIAMIYRRKGQSLLVATAIDPCKSISSNIAGFHIESSFHCFKNSIESPWKRFKFQINTSEMSWRDIEFPNMVTLISLISRNRVG